MAGCRFESDRARRDLGNEGGVDQQACMEVAFDNVEWEACLKVLRSLSAEPDRAPDGDLLGRLVASLYKQERKRRRRLAGSVAKQHDRALVQQALRNREPAGELSAEGAMPVLPALRSVASTDDDALKHRSRSCYICKSRYRRLHRQYHLLCPNCAALNAAKRVQRTDLRGRRALVTGGRVKIGYQTALKFLRDGAEVKAN